jgi:hypothetical protein
LNTASVSSPPEHRKRPLRLRIHTALRWLHIYLSMFSLLVVLFFSATGMTLNHPEWTFGAKETKQDVRGTLPADWKTPKGTDWLKVADYLREKHRVHGTVADRRDEDHEGSISFKAPGYAADCFFDRQTGAYRMEIVGQGPVGILNDLHRGRDAGTTWARLIDLSAIFLIVISLTGIGLLLYLKKMRISGLVTIAVGCLIVLWLIRLAS